jgi:putative transposase
MKTIIRPLLATLAGFLRSRALLHMEILALRQQLAMVSERNRKRLHFRRRERLFWVLLHRIWPGCVRTLHVFKADTLVRWHRKGFRLYWTLKSRRLRGGRPPVAPEVRELIRRMSRENVGWGAPRIHGELRMLGIDISQTTVAKYVIHRRKPPSQTWRTFLDNHLGELVSIDFFTVPTVTFRILYVFLVLKHDRRQVVHLNVTEHPTAQWTAQQLVEAFPWDETPRYLLRDRDNVYGARYRRRVHSLGIEEILTAPRSPWQSPYVERLIGSIRRECLNHVIVVSERHLKRILHLIEQHYPDFLSAMEAQDRPLPGYVQDELEALVQCGRLERGFLRVRCEDCKHEHLVAFSWPLLRIPARAA